MFKILQHCNKIKSFLEFCWEKLASDGGQRNMNEVFSFLSNVPKNAITLLTSFF